MEWRDVVGLEGIFKVSENGDIFSYRSNKILKKNLTDNGYHTIATRVNGKNVMLRINRIVAQAFLEPPSDSLIEECKTVGYGTPVVRHLDDVKTNNFYKNLAWGTHKDNSADFCKTEQHKINVAKMSGRGNVRAKISVELGEEIKRRYKPRCKFNGSRALGREFGIDHMNILRFIKGITYKAA